MKKNIFLLLSISTLAACATFQPQPAFDWRGQNFDSYILEYGVPTSQYTLQDGNTVYSFKKNCPQTNAQEEVLIIINPDNVIQEIYKTSTCPTPPPEPIYYETEYSMPPAYKKPMPKPEEHAAHVPQKDESKAQEATPVYSKNVQEAIEKSEEIQNRIAEINKQLEQNKTNQNKSVTINKKSSEELLREKIAETRKKEQYKYDILYSGIDNTKK